MCVSSPAVSGHCRPDVVDEIVERTDGVPLFVEELTKAVIEAGADRGNASISAVPSLRGRCQQLMGKVAPDGGADLRHSLGRGTQPVEAPQQ